jgi:hypothetical protein
MLSQAFMAADGLPNPRACVRWCPLQVLRAASRACKAAQAAHMFLQQRYAPVGCEPLDEALPVSPRAPGAEGLLLAILLHAAKAVGNHHPPLLPLLRGLLHSSARCKLLSWQQLKTRALGRLGILLRLHWAQST